MRLPQVWGSQNDKILMLLYCLSLKCLGRKQGLMDMSLRRNIDRILRKLERDFETHNRLEVSKSALLKNLDLCIKLGGMPTIPVLKGNAYGHGIELVASALRDRTLPYIAVDGYYEALRIREVSDQPVLIMGSILPQNFDWLKYDNFAFVVGDKAVAQALGATKKEVNIHLECNTGMNRYGASANELNELVDIIKSYKNLKLEGVMSHLADSDAEDPITIDIAVNSFDKCVENILATGVTPTYFHVAQTAGSLRAKSKYANTFRLGIGLYGVNPFPKDHRLYDQFKSLQPVLKFISTITKINELNVGDKVSYNYTFTASRPMKIGVIPAGYYEGLNRDLSNRGLVKIHGQFAPIVGRICMNHTMINLDTIKAKVGDEVVVYSNEAQDKNSIDSTAQELALFNYNLLTSLNHDVRRILVK